MVHGSNDEEFPDNDLVASDYNGNAINAKLGSLVGGTFRTPNMSSSAKRADMLKATWKRERQEEDK